jgi:hypothetical protein
MNDYIEHIQLEYDKNSLLKEMETYNYKPFQNKVKTGLWSDYYPSWLFSQVENKEMSEVNRITSIIAKKINSQDFLVHFFKQQPNTEVPWHIDTNTESSFNIILSDDSAPVLFEPDKEFYYKCAILNVKKRHKVPPYPKERLLLKMSIADVKYHDAVKRWNK